MEPDVRKSIALLQKRMRETGLARLHLSCDPGTRNVVIRAFEDSGDGTRAVTLIPDTIMIFEGEHGQEVSFREGIRWIVGHTTLRMPEVGDTLVYEVGSFEIGCSGIPQLTGLGSHVTLPQVLN